MLIAEHPLDGRALAYLQRKLSGRGWLSDAVEHSLERQKAYTCAFIPAEADLDQTDLYAFDSMVRTQSTKPLALPFAADDTHIHLHEAKNVDEQLMQWLTMDRADQPQQAGLILHDWSGSHGLSHHLCPLIIKDEIEPSFKYLVLPVTEIPGRFAVTKTEIESFFLAGVLISPWFLWNGQVEMKVLKQAWHSAKLLKIFTTAYDSDGYICWQATD